MKRKVLAEFLGADFTLISNIWKDIAKLKTVNFLLPFQDIS